MQVTMQPPNVSEDCKAWDSLNSTPEAHAKSTN